MSFSVRCHQSLLSRVLRRGRVEAGVYQPYGLRSCCKQSLRRGCRVRAAEKESAQK